MFLPEDEDEELFEEVEVVEEGAGGADVSRKLLLLGGPILPIPFSKCVNRSLFDSLGNLKLLLRCVLFSRGLEWW